MRRRKGHDAVMALLINPPEPWAAMRLLAPLDSLNELLYLNLYIGLAE
jgi:hypothetical protein